VELSPDDIAALRAHVIRRTALNAGRGWPVVMLVDGSLDGVRAKLTPPAARCDYVAFCHLTRRALAQVIYRRDTPNPLRVWFGVLAYGDCSGVGV